MELTEQIAELSSQIRQLSEQRQTLIQQWAAQVSPWKIGDITDVRGYTFQGKQCKVTFIGGKLSYSGRPQVQIVGRILKQDGTDGKNMADWCWSPE